MNVILVSLFYLLGLLSSDIGKVASIACGQFLKKLLTFLDKYQILDSFYKSVSKSPQYSSTIDIFLFENTLCYWKIKI